jgi:hypothetical protein
VLDNALDAAVLAGGVSPLQQHENPIAAAYKVPLKLDQLNLQNTKLSCIVIM